MSGAVGVGQTDDTAQSTSQTDTSMTQPTTATAAQGAYISLPAVVFIAAGAFLAGLAVARFLPPWQSKPKKRYTAKTSEVAEEDAGAGAEEEEAA